MDDQILKFWAKTSQDETQSRAFHPLICHLIDVAVVARQMWNEVLPSASKTRLKNALGVDDADNIVAYIAGLHDLGKCSPPFTLRGLNEKGRRTQELLDLYRETDFWCDAVERSISAPHGFVTAVELPEILIGIGFNLATARQIGTLIGGHHGVFPSSWNLNRLRLESYVGKPVWADARRMLAKGLARLLKIDTIQNATVSKLDNGTIMILAGLVSVADWIGSDTQFFDCAIEDFSNGCELDLDEYSASAEVQAEKALKQLGWLDWVEIGEPKAFRELFPFEPRGLQTEAIEIAKDLQSAGIVVIESPMGEGKTEAAMFLADTFNAVLGQRGIYFALPTQATSNQMFGRVEKFLTKRFDRGNIHLQLQHGHSSLSGEFDTLKDNFRNIQGVYEECTDGNCIPHVVAAEWFTYRKRGLLAPFGVGTIDQALMAVLQTKHVFVRLFGLAHKTIIIDEVHAYDAYMSTLLERLLEWLAALGSPVILLSATLPKQRRNALVKAYQNGLNVVGVQNDENVPALTPSDDKYPRVTYATNSTIKIRNIAVSTKTQTLHIKKVNDDFAGELNERLKNGGCAAIVCNTVGRAQDIYHRLSEDAFFADKIDLLHSRFRYCDREEREKRILERFGKPDEAGNSEKRPKCAVLIATQIIEQSLDIDFDVMISDLAPIDLLLQRAGRLHRHDRIERKQSREKEATLWIIKPPLDEKGKLVANKKGLPDFGDSGIVYDKHVLLRTWLELNEKKNQRIEIPREIEDLIEAVYELESSFEKLDGNLVAFWQRTLEICRKEIADYAEQASNRYIKRPSYSQHFSGIFANNLDEDSPEIHQSLQAVTRLTEPTATIICLWQKDGRTFFDDNFVREIDLNDKPTLEQTKELLRYSISISNKSVVFKFLGEEVPKGWQGSALLRNHRVLTFNQNQTVEKFGHIFRLDEKLGLRITKNRGQK